MGKAQKVVDKTDGVAYTRAQFVEYYGEKKANRIWEVAGYKAEAAPKAKAKVKAKAQKIYDFSGLETGMRLQAEAEGKWWAAEVVAVSTKPGSKAPVKVRFVGYTKASDMWLAGDELRSKAISVQGQRVKLTPWKAAPGGLVVASWNLASINNNPFEYWISHNDARYAKMMSDFEQIVDQPEQVFGGSSPDVPVGEVFTDAMYAEMRGLMASAGWEGLEAVDKAWKDDYRERRIISGFLKDKSLGSKRLMSMPDRLTNTIQVTSGAAVCRPTLINNYAGSLPSVAAWWPLWRDFMFSTTLGTKVKGVEKQQLPRELLSKINREKYPAITEEEEKISIPLQTLCLAIFDAVLVHAMNQVLPKGAWQPIKKAIVDAIFEKKAQNCLNVLKNACRGVDIFCLQECSAAFAEGDNLLDRYHKVVPGDADAARAQNSIILLSKARFPDGAQVELTAEARQALPEGAAVEKGDLLLVKARDATGLELLIASFHGDTNGLMTKPVVSAVASVLEKQNCDFVFGLDANTYLKGDSKWQGVDDFVAHCSSLGLRGCWPEGASMEDCKTVCTGRTFLQPQLNKAIRKQDLLTKGDLNPKDHILLRARGALSVESMTKDNTGLRKYLENTPFPSLQFPSDHAVVTAVLSKM